MRLGKHLFIVVIVALMAVLLLIGVVSEAGPATKSNGASPAVAAAVTPIPWEGDTALPPYVGAAANAQPLPPVEAPQNPFFAPNPFSNYHNDTWMSDTYDIAGPLGRKPITTWSSDLAAARKPAATSPLFYCGTLTFDSHGRIVTTCMNFAQTTAVLVDPNSLEVLTSLDLAGAGSQTALGAGYVMLDNLDRMWTPIGDKIFVVQQNGTPTNTTFSSTQFDLSSMVPVTDAITSLVPDFSGRIWFVVRYSGIVGILDPATGSVQQLQLGPGEQIANSFAMDGVDAYMVSTKKLYRLRAGADNVPYVVWSAGYENSGTQKPGQYSAGSGTTPTILNGGRYVAIVDNANQTHVVVYRTAEGLTPEQRLVCQVDVFEPGLGAVEDSPVGAGRSIIVSNNYGYVFNPATLVAPPTQPGVARVDIELNGTGCHKVWTNTQVNPGSYGARLSTATGLAYVVARKLDPSRKSAAYPDGMTVWYWTAIDFQTGKTVWEQLAGTGRWFDGYWPLPFIGPNGALYADGYGGIFAMRDARSLWLPEVRRP